MNSSTLLDFSFSLLLNAILLLGLVQIVDLSLSRDLSKPLPRSSLMTGLLTGGVGMVLIKVSTILMPGVVFDTRSVLLSISGLFLGPMPTLIAMAMTAAYRWLLGGTAAVTGVSVILASGLIGIVWRWFWRRPFEALGWRQLYPLGLVVHVAMLALMLLMPWRTAMAVLAKISLPVMLIYPLLTVALGLFFVERLQHRRDQAILREQEQRYHNLFENNHSVMLIVDPENGAIVDANAAAADYYGWTRQRLKQMSMAEINTQALENIQTDMRRAFNGQCKRFEFRHRRADGTLRDVEVFSGPISIGDRDYLYSIVHDIGARKTAEAALLSSEMQRRREHDEALNQQREARRAALNLMEDAIAARKQAEASLEALQKQRDLNQRYLDTVQALMIALDDRGRITMINRFGCELLGYREAELLGRNWFETCLPQPEGMETVHPVFLRIMAGELQGLEYYENAVRGSDGSLRLIAWHNAQLVDEEGRIVGALSSGEDITERKATMAALRARNEELERFNLAMVDRENVMIALKHEINTLNAQLGRKPAFELAMLDSQLDEAGQ